MTRASSLRPLAVIGAGFSGTMAALHLLPRIGARAILLCERGERFARGVAYGTDDPGHLLNVRATNMSAFPDRPNHFLDWLEGTDATLAQQVHVTEAGTFVSRHLYGSYLVSLLQTAVTSQDGAARLILVPDEVVDLVPEPGGYRLVLAGGVSHEVAGAVLAAGNLLPADTDGGTIIVNPWATAFAEGLRPGEPVVIVGSGLTMVDLALHLQRSGFEGPVVAISRRGLQPRTHHAAAGWPTPTLTDIERASPARLLRCIRREVVLAQRAGVSWHSVVDSLRPITSDLWRGLPPERQNSFLCHARPWWDVHRHRMAPPVGEAMDAMIASGFLTIRAGHVISITEAEAGPDIVFRPRNGTQPTTIQAQRVIHAAGSVALDHCGAPLMDRLIARGLVRPHHHRLGLDQDDDLALIGACGDRTPRAWALGPLGAGRFWECIAVPDIRQQAVRLATAVAVALEASR